VALTGGLCDGRLTNNKFWQTKNIPKSCKTNARAGENIEDLKGNVCKKVGGRKRARIIRRK
jgi:hypothetical protein